MRAEQPKAIHLAHYQPPAFFIDQTRLKIDLFEEHTEVLSTLTFRKNFEAAQTDALVLNGGSNLVTEQILLNGEPLSENRWQVDSNKEELTIWDVPDSFELEIKVRIKPQENTRLEGLYRSGDMFCTQCEAEGFRNIAWYLDRPDVMSKFTTTISAEKAAYPILLSNGNAVASGEEGIRHWVTWEDPFKKPAYLFAMVAGQLERREDEFITQSGRKVTLRIFSEARNIDKVDWAMDCLKRAMRWDEQVYGREYDLDIFMIVAVESFNMGAMENKGLNIFNTACILASPETATDDAYQQVESVVAHEYFHNWSGNRVTCRDWFQLSLKEGFTVFRDQQFSAAMSSETVARINDVATLRAVQFAEDAGPTAHPVQPDSYIEINNFYTTTVYEKGAEVVRMIHTLLGEKRFRAGCDLYFSRHDGQAVTIGHFVAAMEEANGLSLEQFRLWYQQSGTPTLTIASEYYPDEQALELTVTQQLPPTPGQPQKKPMHMPVAVGLLSADGRDMHFQVEPEDLARLDQSDDRYTAVLSLTQAKQRFRLSGVDERPVPSLLRQFSAPTKLSYDYSKADLEFLLCHDADGFNRWEAGQQLATLALSDLIQNPSQMDSATEPRLISAFGSLLTEAVSRHHEPSFDKALIADILSLPSEAWLAELFEPVEVLAIHNSRKAIYQKLAVAHEQLLLKLYQLNYEATGHYQPDAHGIGRRALANVALHYLMEIPDSPHLSLCLDQINKSNNMTDYHLAVRILVHHPGMEARTHRLAVLKQYRERFAADELGLDRWFALQATDPVDSTMEEVTALLSHPDFKLAVPNRARSLIGAFAFHNPVQFHRTDGRGYTFLGDQILALNPVNPQIAARLLTPLSKWRKFDSAKQALMTEQLERILRARSVSKDVFEIANKSLKN